MPQISPLAVLKNLLTAQAVGTQEEIKARLQAQGIAITQSQISRLLKKLGAVKTMNGRGETVYAFAEEPPTAAVARMIVDMAANEALIVIHTSPGSAPLVAGFLDHHAKELNILGTVAGDDTLFVAPAVVSQIQEVKRAVAAYLEFSSD